MVNQPNDPLINALIWVKIGGIGVGGVKSVDCGGNGVELGDDGGGLESDVDDDDDDDDDDPLYIFNWFK